MKTKSRVLALLLALVLCFSTLATTAFAYAEDQDPEPETTTQETTAPEVEEELPPVETQPVVAETGSGFADEGNLITRDLLFDKNTNKQFITVQTRNGEVFYIIIDYDKPTDEKGDHYETYFLNLVDEADIKALLEAAGVTETCDCGDKCIAGAVNTACDICRKNMTECLGIEKIPETQPVDPTEPSEPAEKPNEGGNSTAILAVVLLVAIGGGAVFFFVKNKKPDPKTKGSTDLNDYDYGMDDDEEYAEFEAYEEEEDK